MSRLLALPDELIESIINITFTRGGLQNLVTSCRTIHRIGLSQIRKYNYLRKKWRSTRPHYNKRHYPLSTSLDLIVAITQDPQIAWFIEDLDLNDALDLNNRGEWHDRDDIYIPWLPPSWTITDTTTAEQARQLVLQSPILQAANQIPETWLVAIDAVDENGEPLAFPPTFRRTLKQRIPSEEYQHHYWRTFRTVFLLSLLPNLKRLKLPSTWGHIAEFDTPESCTELLNFMVTEVRRDMKGLSLPLSNLEQVLLLEKVCSQPDPRCSLEVLAPFTILPGLKKMHASNIITVNDESTLAGIFNDESGIPFRWPYGNAVSNLRIIKLEGCAINAAGISEFLSHIPQVVSFSYTHDSKYRGCEGDWDAGAFATAVGITCGHNLKELRIGYEHWFSSWTRNPVQSLEGFAKLETLTMHVNAVGAPLSDLLPCSVKNVNLESEIEDLTEATGIPVLFKNADLLCSESKFPYLENLVMEIYVTEVDETHVDEMPSGGFPTAEDATLSCELAGPFDTASNYHQCVWHVNCMTPKRIQKKTMFTTHSLANFKDLISAIRNNEHIA